MKVNLNAHSVSEFNSSTTRGSTCYMLHDIVDPLGVTELVQYQRKRADRKAGQKFRYNCIRILLTV